ncbi:hypothetical protein BU24DRAFT_376521 [Aaosphaeria arxii CBS 175.79]|uniref:Nucleoporin n=1 Tax=Aaosphaeria arxii CBS 175.79 TaxID=1450172 RepID=A0A6A5XEP9_9PLEO|nr:uncharacterized protein BU24DRAFT_376521 [Aaosphaeria arxii CBS 175.79]KAF2011390.1 hypothetical protein BU24DRAFT_376521 [Aaosphaeria arxii CBS 175.79]
MSEFEDSLGGLEGLHRDLTALVYSKLPVLERLTDRLEAYLDEFQTLLDKKPRNDASRKELAADKVKLGEVEYNLNDDFKQNSLDIAEGLDLDEIEAAKLFLDAEKQARDFGDSQIKTAFLRFHKRREYVVLCIRILMKAVMDNNGTELEDHEILSKAVRIIIGLGNGTGNVNFGPAHAFWDKCLKTMQTIEAQIQQNLDRLQKAHIVGTVASSELIEIINLQQDSLTRQHEHLAAICTHMVKPGFASLENFKTLLSRLKTLDRHDIITIHYTPIVVRLISWIAAEENVSTRDARALHQTLMAGRESDNWLLRSFHAATITWWLAEYSGRYIDPSQQDPDLQGIDLDKEANERSEAFLKALDDGAFHFILSVSQDMRPAKGYNPTKTSMISLLLQDTAVLPPDSPQPEPLFPILVMEQHQVFVDSFITNMPDTLRKLKVEEDDQRKRLQVSFQRTTGDQPFHLERFLVIVSFAFDGFPEAAEEFWADKESNLYGFLQWAAKRQPTPRIAMFCEMLRAISCGEANSESAHQFLLEEGTSASGKIRRTSSLSYSHIFLELVEFQTNLHEPKKNVQGALYPSAPNPVDQIVEPESASMLESYLRLLSHLCQQNESARSYILNYGDYNFAAICFGLCADNGVAALRASAFDALAALLIGKTVERGDAMWYNLEEWVANGFYAAAKQSGAINPVPRDEVWATLADGYDESLAFIRLLDHLVQPCDGNPGLNDTLPFPENLGSSRRMPGIEKFIDFVMYDVFAEHTLEIQDPVQQNVLRWHCFRFMLTCLTTFNENLVIFANKSSIPVDSVIGTSSLQSYVTLHPFSRVMEWLFNDKVIKALFASCRYDVKVVNAAATDSPLIESLLLGIQVMDSVMKLQATYLDIVRPVLKQQSSFQRSPVSNLSLTSFEDAVLNNLQVIVDLGLYCGTGHEELTIKSLLLLRKFASSRKLAVSPAGFGQRSGRSKIVGILERDNEAEQIGRLLVDTMQIREEEFEYGPVAPSYRIKIHVLDFLNSCLAAVSTRPTLAHILLGFSCESTTVRIAEDGLWSNGQSLFHAILIIAANYPEQDGITFVPWQSEIKARAWEILQRLWRSRLTSAIVMEELRTNELLFMHAPSLLAVDAGTLWDGVSLAQAAEEQADVALSDFFSGPPAAALQHFLQQRAAFLDYESRELRLTVKESMLGLKSRIQSVLLGITIRPGEDQIPNLDIFDLFGFTDFNFPERHIPESKLLEGISLSILQEDDDGVVTYSLPLAEQLFLLRIKAWKKDGTIRSADEETEAIVASDQMLLIFADYNRRTQLARYQKDILRSWVQVLTIAIQSGEFDENVRTSLILQTIQVILPKLEMAYNYDAFTALQLAGLAETLIQKVDFESTAFEKTRTGDFANDRLSQLFRAALVGIYCPVSSTELRELCYQVVFRYIQGTLDKAGKDSPLSRHILIVVKSLGGHMLEIVCDDAYGGQGTCKVSALLVLSALVAVAIRQESKYVLESFVSLNFIGVLVDNIKHIPDELKAAPASQTPLLLSYYDASLALLLRICQTRLGAAYVLNAGFFPAIRESRIFDVDPDIGLEFDNPNALHRYFDLMLSILRVINAAVIARGRQNEQTIFQAREFLKENRQSMVSIFKRSVNIGAIKDGVNEDLSDLVDCWTVLVEITGFLQYEDTSSLKKTRPNVFS